MRSSGTSMGKQCVSDLVSAKKTNLEYPNKPAGSGNGKRTNLIVKKKVSVSYGQTHGGGMW
jgi:hypothetical protein